MLAIGESLKQFWSRQNIKLRRGAPEVELREFEAKYNVVLPDDLKDYFATVDGFDDSDSDENLFTFLPLAEVTLLDESWSSGTFDAKSYFVFIDYCISAHLYAIRLTNDLSLGNPVVTTYVKPGENPIQIAGSFSEFVQGYLADDYSVLFPPSQVEQFNGREGETATLF